MKKVRNIHSYFRVGDTVLWYDVWGKKLFKVDSLFGNSYLPRLMVHPINKNNSVGNMCIFLVHSTTLIDSRHRPFRKLDMKLLVKLLKSGNPEVKKEIKIRSNRKRYNHV